MSYGNLQIIDGIYNKNKDPNNPILSAKPGNLTFNVDLYYSKNAHIFNNNSNIQNINNYISYQKSFKRLASGANPIRDAKNFVAQFAGCDEASKLRKRIIALAKMKVSISNDVFRFPIEES